MHKEPMRSHKSSWTMAWKGFGEREAMDVLVASQAINSTSNGF